MPPACTGLNIQSTRQCSATVNASVSRFPVPCHVFSETQFFAGSAAAGGASCVNVAGAIVSAGLVEAAGSADRLVLIRPELADIRLSTLAAGKPAATAPANFVVPACASHQRAIVGIGLVSIQRSTNGPPVNAAGPPSVGRR